MADKTAQQYSWAKTRERDMKMYRKWDIVPILVIAGLITAWWSYTHTDQFKARKLVTELRYLKGTFQSPSGKDRWIFTAGLATPRTRGFHEVAKELVAMGDPAVPFLIEGIQELGSGHDNSNACAHVLVAIGSPSVNPLVEALKELPGSETQKRMMITDVLGAIKPPAMEAVPVLLQDIHSDNGVVRNLSARALGRINRQLAAEKALPIVLKDLKSHDLGVQFYATWALRDIGPVTTEAEAAIQKARQGRYKELFRVDQIPTLLEDLNSGLTGGE